MACATFGPKGINVTAAAERARITLCNEPDNVTVTSSGGARHGEFQVVIAMPPPPCHEQCDCTNTSAFGCRHEQVTVMGTIHPPFVSAEQAAQSTHVVVDCCNLQGKSTDVAPWHVVRVQRCRNVLALLRRVPGPVPHHLPTHRKQPVPGTVFGKILLGRVQSSLLMRRRAGRGFAQSRQVPNCRESWLDRTAQRDSRRWWVHILCGAHS